MALPPVLGLMGRKLLGTDAAVAIRVYVLERRGIFQALHLSAFLGVFRDALGTCLVELVRDDLAVAIKIKICE